MQNKSQSITGSKSVIFVHTLWNFREEYVTDINITKYDIANNITYKIQIVEAFPITMPDQEIGYDNTEVLNLNVTFNYSRWVILENEEN